MSHYQWSSQVVKFTFTLSRSIDPTYALTLPSADGKYTIEVSIDGPAATARWYDLRGATVAVVGMCRRSGDEGLATG